MPPDKIIITPCGNIAFVTSKGTMDKQNPNVRKYIAERAELIGAIRLPNNAFYANAGMYGGNGKAAYSVEE